MGFVLHRSFSLSRGINPFPTARLASDNRSAALRKTIAVGEGAVALGTASAAQARPNNGASRRVSSRALDRKPLASLHDGRIPLTTAILSKETRHAYLHHHQQGTNDRPEGSPRRARYRAGRSPVLGSPRRKSRDHDRAAGPVALGRDIQGWSRRCRRGREGSKETQRAHL